MPRNISVIQVYAPTSDYSDYEVERFYSQPEVTIKNIPNKDILVVVGDCNAHVKWPGTAGKFGLGCTNETGLRLREFAKLYNLVVANAKCRRR